MTAIMQSRQSGSINPAMVAKRANDLIRDDGVTEIADKMKAISDRFAVLGKKAFTTNLYQNYIAATAFKTKAKIRNLVVPSG